MKLRIETALLPLALLAACKSSPPPAPRPLPFRVAVVPLENVRVREPSAEESDTTTDMKLQLDRARFTRAVLAALDRRVFTDVVLLQAPETKADPADSAVDWNELALQRDADAILDLSLACQPRILERSNVNFYLNFPLFLIGGPFCWFLKDHTYAADAALHAKLYDVRKLGRQKSSLSSTEAISARVTEANARFAQVDMNFNSRVDGVSWEYALSVVWPAPLIATDNDTVREMIEQEVMQDLASGLAGSLQTDRESLILASGIAPFFLDADRARLEKLPDGTHRLRATLLLPKVRPERPQHFRIKFGTTTQEHALAAPAPFKGNERLLAYSIDEALSLPAGTAFLGLEIEAETTDTFTRSYTFSVP